MKLKLEDIYHWLTPEQKPVKDFIIEQAEQIVALQKTVDIFKIERDLFKAENARLKDEKHILECKLTSAINLLQDALPNIECSNGNQDGLITAIGEYLAAPPQKGQDNANEFSRYKEFKRCSKST